MDTRLHLPSRKAASHFVYSPQKVPHFRKADQGSLKTFLPQHSPEETGLQQKQKATGGNMYALPYSPKQAQKNFRIHDRIWEAE